MHISTLNKCQNASLGARQSEDGKDIVYARGEREGEGEWGAYRLYAAHNVGSIFHYIPMKYKPCRK